MKPAVGDKITVVVGDGTLHARVVARQHLPDTSFTFNVNGAPPGTPSFAADDDHDGVTWVRGWLRWWSRRDRAVKRALLAAHALGEDRVRETNTVYTTLVESLEAVKNLFGDFEKIAGDFDKVADDFERVVYRKPSRRRRS